MLTVHSNFTAGIIKVDLISKPSWMVAFFRDIYVCPSLLVTEQLMRGMIEQQAIHLANLDQSSFLRDEADVPQIT